MTSSSNTKAIVDFTKLDLDDRLVRSLAKLGYNKPTPIQSQCINLGLEGKDILAKAKTGSGKTLAYILPILHMLLKEDGETDIGKVRGLVLVPTRELAEQVASQFQEICQYCTYLKIYNISAIEDDRIIRTHLKDLPHIIIGTPSRVLHFLNSKTFTIKESLRHMVIDEADLVLSFGYEQDVRQILTHIPDLVQSFLVSATLNKELDELKKIVLKNPAVIEVEVKEKSGELVEYTVECKVKDKFLLLYVMLRLKLIHGKCLIFVNDVDRCYRVKLYLEQFGIKCCVLNSDLPLNSRYHIIQEFNKGVYDYVIASDEAKLRADRDSDDETEIKEEEDIVDIKDEETKEEDAEIKEDVSHEIKIEEEEGMIEVKEEGKFQSKKRKPKFNPDMEYGVSRGVDFKNVAAVINFDFPISTKSYCHRIGRTARGGRRGMALSLIANDVEEEFTRYETVHGRRTQQGFQLIPYTFDMHQVNGFRYRSEDAEKAVTKGAIKQARVLELKREILNSDLLKDHFDDRPNELELLRHDQHTLPNRVKPHLKTVPQYLMPKLATMSKDGSAIYGGDRERTFTPAPSKKPRIQFEDKHQQARRKGKKRHDPLKTFTPSKLSGSKRSKK